MMDDSRADSFLRLIRRSERGKHKIYLGYCAGVGKTYRMLEEAHRLRTEGIDVVVGFVETYGRRDVAALLEGLDAIPRRTIVHRGVGIEEMDLDAIMAGKHPVVLVDELAHTNVPGSKHARRYQDVEEILAAGIHVISTLNVQHLESLCDTVEQTVGARVRERIPDRVIAEADQIVNVDLTTQDLLKRLQDGKIYPEKRMGNEPEGLYTREHLEQLRELTLRELAAQIDSRRRDPRDSFEDGPRSAPDQVMVCLGSEGPNSEMLLRYASRLAGRLNRTWYAVYVQTPAEAAISVSARTRSSLPETLALAQQLGAMVFTYRGEDIVATILEFAREYRVGHIVIGSPGRKLPFLKRLLGKSSLIERLIEESREKTIVVLDTRRATTDRASSLKESGWAALAEAPPKMGDLHLSHLIEERRVLVWTTPPSKEEAIRQLVDACARDLPGATLDSLLQAVLDRERQGSTFFNEGAGLPHARIRNLSRSIAALGISPAGVVDNETGTGVQLVFLTLTHSHQAQLRVLATIGKLAQDKLAFRGLVEARSAQRACSVLRAWEDSHATRRRRRHTSGTGVDADPKGN